jgi:hypothetical protein
MNTFHTQVEAAQFISGKTVCSTLQDNGARTIPFHDLADNGLENAFISERQSLLMVRRVRFIVDAVAQREIDSIVFTNSNAVISQISSSREIFSVLVKRHRHDPVSGIKRPIL